MNLPNQLTSFIGRERDMIEVKRLLSLTRLLTLTGPGGCGKTRLAIQAATDQLEQFADGVWLVELGMLSDVTLVARAVAQALSVGEQTGQSMTKTLLDYLQHREMLLVLDNCEHLIEVCAELAEILLHNCPRLHLLTTSREVLNIVGETSWTVPSLSLPDVHEVEHLPSLEHLIQYEAIRLFLERAATALPTFTLASLNTTMAVMQICRRLDGIPLAIELAAARMKILSAEQIAARLDDRFHLLTGGSRTALPRHQTLRATMDWSYDLLTAKEQALFRRLTVFVGGFTMEAVEAICTGNDLDEVLDLLSHLVNKSLVVVEQHGSEPRYRLLETMRQYGKEKLQDSNEHLDTHRRHRDWYLNLAERAQPKLKGAEQKFWLDRLAMEHDNLRASLEWALEQGEWETLVRVATALSHFWSVHGHFSEGHRWLEAGLANCEGLPMPLRAEAFNAKGMLTVFQGDCARASTDHEKSLALFQAVEDNAGIAITLHHLGYIAERRGNYAQARLLLEKSLNLFRALEDKWGIALVANRLGGVAGKQGNAEEIIRLYKESLALRREIRDSIGLAQSLHNLGYMYSKIRDYTSATALLKESLELSQVLGDKRGMAIALHNLGCTAFEQRDFEQARWLLEEGLQLFWKVGDKATSAESLEELAGVAGAQKQVERAARLWGAAATIRTSIDAPHEPFDLTPYREKVASTRTQADEASFAKYWAEGQAMSMEQAIAYVRSTRPHSEMVQPPPGRSRSIEAKAPAELRIFSLGQVQVYRGEYTLTSSDWTYTKGRELLFYLLCYRSRTKEQIGLALWPEASTNQLRNNFRVTMYHLRRALGGPEWITRDGQYYAFNRQRSYWFDVEAFERCLAEARRCAAASLEQEMQCLEEAVTLYQGNFLENLETGDWLLLRREALQKRYLEALFMLGQLLLAQAKYPQAVDAFLQIIAYDSYHEAAHRELMRCYARKGERGQAVKCYQALFVRLHDELGFVPNSETAALFERLRRGGDL